VHTEPLPESFQ